MLGRRHRFRSCGQHPWDLSASLGSVKLLAPGPANQWGHGFPAMDTAILRRYPSHVIIFRRNVARQYLSETVCFSRIRPCLRFHSRKFASRSRLDTQPPERSQPCCRMRFCIRFLLDGSIRGKGSKSFGVAALSSSPKPIGERVQGLTNEEFQPR